MLSGRFECAGEVLAAARVMLRDRAARISDVHIRRSFLEQVPLHRQVQERTTWIDPTACA